MVMEMLRIRCYDLSGKYDRNVTRSPESEKTLPDQPGPQA
jgi:hypothetical protein